MGGLTGKPWLPGMPGKPFRPGAPKAPGSPSRPRSPGSPSCPTTHTHTHRNKQTISTSCAERAKGSRVLFDSLDHRCWSDMRFKKNTGTLHLFVSPRSNLPFDPFDPLDRRPQEIPVRRHRIVWGWRAQNEQRKGKNEDGLIILTGNPLFPWGPGSPESPSRPNSPVIPASPPSPAGPGNPGEEFTTSHSHSPWSPKWLQYFPHRKEIWSVMVYIH